MRLFIVLTCLVCALAKPANEKRFFGIFGKGKTTAHPALNKLKNAENEVGKFIERLRNHHVNVTNSTNAAFDEIAHTLHELEEDAESEIDGFVEKFDELKDDLKNDLEGARTLVEEAQDIFNQQQESYRDHAIKQVGQIKKKFN